MTGFERNSYIVRIRQYEKKLIAAAGRRDGALRNGDLDEIRPWI